VKTESSKLMICKWLSTTVGKNQKADSSLLSLSGAGLLQTLHVPGKQWSSKQKSKTTHLQTLHSVAHRSGGCSYGSTNRRWMLLTKGSFRM